MTNGLRELRELFVRPVAALHRLMADQEALAADAAMYRERNEQPRRPLAEDLPSLLIDYPEFRNIFYYRIERDPRGLGLLAALGRRIVKPVPNLELACDEIGPGLVISHGDGTILTARRIGARLWVHHQVTVGFVHGEGRHPEIGDDVFIGAGAKVLGNLRLGDGCRIGANAVVLADVPAKATAVGVPARIIPGKGTTNGG